LDPVWIETGIQIFASIFPSHKISDYGAGV
jgi:hypothetical protein